MPGEPLPNGSGSLSSCQTDTLSSQEDIDAEKNAGWRHILTAELSHNYQLLRGNIAMQSKQQCQPVPAAVTSFNVLPDDALVDDKVVAAIFSCSRKTVWCRAKKGGIWPRPIKVSTQTTRFRVGDIRKALAALTAA